MKGINNRCFKNINSQRHYIIIKYINNHRSKHINNQRIACKVCNEKSKIPFI